MMDLDTIGTFLEHQGFSDDAIDEYFHHSGVKGMKWGQRRSIRRASFKELRGVKNQNKQSEKEASKDSTFKREVKATKKKQGISGMTDAQKTKTGGLLTGRGIGNFKNSKGEKVSTDFANAVLHKAVKDQDRNRTAKIGATYTAAILLPMLAFKYLR